MSKRIKDLFGDFGMVLLGVTGMIELLAGNYFVVGCTVIAVILFAIYRSSVAGYRSEVTQLLLEGKTPVKTGKYKCSWRGCNYSTDNSKQLGGHVSSHKRRIKRK